MQVRITELSYPSTAIQHCSGGNSELEPLAQLYGNECIVGHYCPNGTHTPIACPPGTYPASTRMGCINDCRPCFPGIRSYS